MKNYLSEMVDKIKDGSFADKFESDMKEDEHNSWGTVIEMLEYNYTCKNVGENTYEVIIPTSTGNSNTFWISHTNGVIEIITGIILVEDIEVKTLLYLLSKDLIWGGFNIFNDTLNLKYTICSYEIINLNVGRILGYLSNIKEELFK
ncbi:MAG: hypothetical protein B6229_08555 [Spirochaetaceae bacterium 4572_7]|nr:MAG: hypothetical protein B6229_08555 [Spirochaetaceae bacterium 4572_7]